MECQMKKKIILPAMLERNMQEKVKDGAPLFVIALEDAQISQTKWVGRWQIHIENEGNMFYLARKADLDPVVLKSANGVMSLLSSMNLSVGIGLKEGDVVKHKIQNKNMVRGSVEGFRISPQ